MEPEYEKIVEVMAEAAHESWMKSYLDQGYTSRKAEWGEEFMVPYEQLSERGKDLDRTIMRAILTVMLAKGYQIISMPASDDWVGAVDDPTDTTNNGWDK